MTTVRDVEFEVEQSVNMMLERRLRELGVLPPGYRCAVRLQGPNRDKKRTADFAGSWDPDDDSIRIEFEEVESQTEPTIATDPEPPRFRPAPIRGEPLSATVLRDRR